MSFARDFILRLEDVDANYFVTNKAILELMENTADDDSAHADDDIMSLNEKGLSWVIVEWNLVVFGRPKYRTKVTVHTWPREVTSRYVWRDFEVHADSQKIAAASSKWMQLNLAQKSLAHFDAEHVARYEIDPRSAMDLSNNHRISALNSYPISKPATLRDSDIDINGHLHNLAYLDLIKEVYVTEPSKMRIIFHREIKLGDDVVVKSTTDNGQANIAITNSQGDIYSLAELS